MLPTVRAAAVMAAGALPALLWPRPATVLSWILLVVLAVLVDALLAASPRRIELDRTPPLSVRPGEPTSSALLLTNAGTRTLRGLVRDAWPPSAGAATNRHRVQVPAGERRRVRTGLLATRRGRLEADLVTIRSVGPLGLGFRQRSLEAPASIVVLPPFRSRRHLPSKLARLREIDGQTTLLSRARARSSTRCASTSTAMTSAPSTGVPRLVAPTSWCAPGGPSATAAC